MRIALALLAALATLPTKEQSTPIKISVDCPRSIETAQQPQTKVEGWTADIRTEGHNLNDVEFFEGPPSQLIAIHGEKAGTAKKPLVRWELEKDKTIWVSCSYRDTKVVMNRQLPPGLTRCEMSHDPMARWMIIAVTCS